MTKTEGWGTLKGQVTLKGSAPKLKELAPKGKADKDPEVCAKDRPIVSERLVVDEASKGVKNVLVYLPKPSAVNEEARSNAESGQIVFDQEKCVFVPHVLAVMKGAKVDLKNSDPVNHNINSRLKNNGFNKLLSASQDAIQTIDAAERSPGELTCDIHPWMRAYWLVLDNPYFAVTDEKGNYEIITSRPARRKSSSGRRPPDSSRRLRGTMSISRRMTPRRKTFRSTPPNSVSNDHRVPR